MSRRRLGIHGGQLIPETLISAVTELEEAYECYRKDPQFKAELEYLLEEYTGHPSRLYYAEKMTKDLGRARIYPKREDSGHTGSHRINDALEQILLTKKMGRTRAVTEVGVGQHGVVTAIATVLLGLECEVYMDKEDTDRQALNVYRMELLGAKAHPVTNGTQILKDAVDETLREWTNRISDTHYVIGSVTGPHPFPMTVRDFRSVINGEIKEQLMEKEGKFPDMIITCMGGGDNAMGASYEFINEKDVKLVGYRTAGRDVETEQTAATIATDRSGIFYGMESYSCQGEYGQVTPVYSVLAGLDYPGTGPEHTQLHDNGRTQYVPVIDDEAVDSFGYLPRMGGIIPTVGSAYAMAYARKTAGSMDKDQIIVINLSGRGGKDVAVTARREGVGPYE